MLHEIALLVLFLLPRVSSLCHAQMNCILRCELNRLYILQPLHQEACQALLKTLPQIFRLQWPEQLTQQPIEQLTGQLLSWQSSRTGSLGMKKEMILILMRLLP